MRIGISNGSVQVDLRSFVEVGRRSVKTAAGLYFSPKYLPRVIETLQRASETIESWELERDGS